ncbi:dipeptidyl-peptidase III [Hortaea werneckii]|nr:dipeptidyl-peptidase III [Hortaea werneckii]
MTSNTFAGACSKAEVRVLSSTSQFESLLPSEKVYAHYSAKAAWLGTRIILRQVSPESEPIFDFIIHLYHSCNGKWEALSNRLNVSNDELTRFLDFAAMFLGNIGNFYGHGDQKFLPNVTTDTLRKLSSTSEVTRRLMEKFESVISAPLPNMLGLPSSTMQSGYYQASSPITQHEVAEITRTAAQSGIHPENTRLAKISIGQSSRLDIMQASVEKDAAERLIFQTHEREVRLVRGDHSSELRQICEYLQKASGFTKQAAKKTYIAKLCRSFQTGDMEEYKDSQRIWIHDHLTTVETVFGFVEPYRDPCGSKAEYEGIVGVENPGETAMLHRLCQSADSFVKRLPWVESHRGDKSMGDFEESTVQRPSFVSIEAIAYCSSLVFPGINLPNYNDIRQEEGSKSIVISNRLDGSPMAGDSLALNVCEDEPGTFSEHRRAAYYLWVVFHELFGHGTGKLLKENADNTYNFGVEELPVSPLTGEPIDSWYKPGETWTSVFQDIATSVDECRAECIGAYLMSETDLLSLCGYTDDGLIRPEDLEYNMYQQLAIAGIRSLENYSVEEESWGQAHSQVSANGHSLHIQLTSAKFRHILRYFKQYVWLQLVSLRFEWTHAERP